MKLYSKKLTCVYVYGSKAAPFFISLALSLINIHNRRRLSFNNVSHSLKLLASKLGGLWLHGTPPKCKIFLVV
jgi:hypothetical protein